jgi:hypothetical protein
VNVAVLTLMLGVNHGLPTIPNELAAEIPMAAAKLQGAEQKVIDFCQSKNFSVDRLRQMMKDLG